MSEDEESSQLIQNSGNDFRSLVAGMYQCEFNSFTNLIINVSQNYPVIYGMASVSIAIIVGIVVAYSFKKVL